MSSRSPDTDWVRNRPEISSAHGEKEQHECPWGPILLPFLWLAGRDSEVKE